MNNVVFDEWDKVWSSVAGEDVERVARIVRRVLRAPAALLSSSDQDGAVRRFPSGDRQFLPHGTMGPDTDEDEQTTSFEVISALPVLASFDAPVFASGRRIGSLTVFDRSPRSWSEEDRATLADLAECLSEIIVLRHQVGTSGGVTLRVSPASSAETNRQIASSADATINDEAEAVAGSGSHILLADDLDLNRKLICDMLSLEGHVVDSVADGASAVKAAGEHQYDLILMDMIMPGMDGVAATRAIRALPAPACEVPIVALTAHSMPEQLESCLQAGMDATLVKPMTMDALTSAVATWTRMRRKAA